MARWFIVDDDLDDRTLFEVILEQVEGIEAEILSSGYELLDRLDSGDRPDLLFLDLGLPDLLGLEVIAQIRETDATSALPIVVLSATTDLDQVDHAYRNGANVFFTKPRSFVAMRELFVQIRDHWSMATLPQGASPSSG